MEDCDVRMAQRDRLAQNLGWDEIDTQISKQHWEIMKIHVFSLIFDEKTWIFMISQWFWGNLGNTMVQVP